MDTAIDMHKLIRFLTITLANDGYLNFMGNEFGHPEWIDFPREGNGWSYKYARRQWSLVQNPEFKFQWLGNFDRDMIHFIRKHKLHMSGKPDAIWLDEQKNVMIFTRGDLIYVFNLHPTQSQEDVFVHCGKTGEGKYRVVFSSDDARYGGQDRIQKKHTYFTWGDEFGLGFKLYMPCRTAAVLKKVKTKKK